MAERIKQEIGIAERRVCADAGYRGVEKREENQGRDVEWRVAMAGRCPLRLYPQVLAKLGSAGS